MKFEKKGFVPIVITIETEEEASAIRAIITEGLAAGARYSFTLRPALSKAELYGTKLLEGLRS